MASAGAIYVAVHIGEVRGTTAVALYIVYDRPWVLTKCLICSTCLCLGYLIEVTLSLSCSRNVLANGTQ